MKFSNRTDWNTEESEFAGAHRDRVAKGLPIADLTASNPTRCGFTYPPELLAPLADPAAFDYDPNPRGLLQARESVCRYYADHGAAISPENLLLTTSTSEAYSYLLRLLCDPGDAILVPQPSYPLFDFLAQAESVRLAATPLVYDHGWQLDLESLRRILRDQRTGGRVRAIVLVHPNNPTGHFTSLRQSEELAELCREHDLALIVDEVFLDYATASSVSAQDCSTFAQRDLSALTFIVSGISKICGLPQMKAAWLVALGPNSDKALVRLEVLADTYLSMNAPVQHALPAWLAGRSAIQEQIRSRTQDNLAELDRALVAKTSPGSDSERDGQILVNRLEIEGGWYAILRIPATQLDELTVRELLELGVLIHPGYFFGMRATGWLVVSLLAKTEEFQTGMARLLEYVRRNWKSNL